MTARALAWFEDDDPRDLFRWSVAAAVVVCVYAVLIAGYAFWPQPPPIDFGDNSPIAIDLTVPEIEQQEQAKVEEPPPPQQTTTDVTLPEEKPPEKVEPTNPTPRSIERTDAASPHIDPSWQSLLFKQLQRFKSYPSGARARNEQGVVKLNFTVDRDGHVLSRQIVTGSGYPELDAEVLTMVERAQPLPAFPASMTQAQQDFTVPIRFSLTNR
jgi:periplasmic protein TonB